MATIKAYSDLEQSKKLAEILPLESADMVYQSIEDEYGDGEWEVIPRNNSLNIGYDDDIPCWSLVALLGVLPCPTLYQQWDGTWGLDAWVERVKGCSVKNVICEVDACYEMILKLHELKML